MSTNVIKHFKRGNFYARERYWNEAAKPFIAALQELYDGAIECDPISWSHGGNFELELETLQSTTSKNGPHVRISTKVAERPVFRDLQRFLERQHPSVGDLHYVDAFCVPEDLRYGDASARHWIIVFLDVIESSYHDVRVQLPARSMRQSYHVRIAGDSVELWPVTTGEEKRLSYAWAHLGQAYIHSMLDQFREDQLLVGNAESPLIDLSIYYHNALLLQPGNWWALAQFGEIFRNLANSAPGDRLELGVEPFINRRLHNYIRALIYLRNSLDINPKSAWTNAHLGAAIVNVRAFVGCIGEDSGQSLPRALEELLRAWFPPGQARPSHEASTPQQMLLDFINYSNRRFASALELRPVYTWCSVYYSGGLLLKAMFESDGLRDGAHRSKESYHLSTMGRVLLEQAIYMDPDIVKKMFDPGRLWVNAVYEVGLVYFYLGEYQLAWDYILVGMSFLSKFGFLMGLQSLSGCHMLANVAYRQLSVPSKSTAQATRDEVNLLRDMGYTRANLADTWLPTQLPTSKKELREFVTNALLTYCVPYVAMLFDAAPEAGLKDGDNLDNKVFFDWLSVDMIFCDLWQILLECKDTLHLSKTEERLKGLLEKIEQTSHFSFSFDHDDVDGKVVAADLLFHLTTRTLGYYSSNRVVRHVGGA